MLVFETILGLLLGAAILSTVAQRLNIPYPTLLAAGRRARSPFVPDAPRLDLPSELTPRALRRAGAAGRGLRCLARATCGTTGARCSSLVLVCSRRCTTVAVGVRRAPARCPDLPWAAAIALGAHASRRRMPSPRPGGAATGQPAAPRAGRSWKARAC